MGNEKKKERNWLNSPKNVQIAKFYYLHAHCQNKKFEKYASTENVQSIVPNDFDMFQLGFIPNTGSGMRRVHAAEQ